MGKFKRGQSGNPAGRPRGAKNKSTKEIKELIAERVPFEKMVDKLFAMALKGDTRAAELLLSYRFGKPFAEIKVDASMDRGAEALQKAQEWLSHLAILELPSASPSRLLKSGEEEGAGPLEA